jgi:predicted nucleic acid-binding protein
MPWVVDTCLLLDIGLDDPKFAERSERLLNDKGAEGLVLCPVTFVELTPLFGGQIRATEEFLDNYGIDYQEDWKPEDTNRAAVAWSVYMVKRRTTGSARRPVADALIGTFALRFDGILTRKRVDFARLAPGLRIVEP